MEVEKLRKDNRNKVNKMRSKNNKGCGMKTVTHQKKSQLVEEIKKLSREIVGDKHSRVGVEK